MGERAVIGWIVAGGVATVLVGLVVLLSVVVRVMQSETRPGSRPSQMALAVKSFPPGTAMYWLGDDADVNDDRGLGFLATSDGLVSPPVDDRSTMGCVGQALTFPDGRWRQALMLTYLPPAPAPAAIDVPQFCGQRFRWTVEAVVRKPAGEVVAIAFSQFDVTTAARDRVAARWVAQRLQAFPAAA